MDADLLVYEDNLGKEWLAEVLRDAYHELQLEGVFPPGGSAPMKPVVAMKGKRLRAQPTAMRYEQGRCHHVGTFPELEDQQATWVPDVDKDSPDRIDALVHAQAYLRSREYLVGDVADPGEPLPRTDPYGS